MKESLLGFLGIHSKNIIDLGIDIITAIIIIVVGKIVIKSLQRIVTRARASGLNIDDTVASLLKVVIHYGILIICFIMILNIFGVNTTSLIAVLGAAGVAVGLALKDTLGNIAAGIILLFLRSFRIGDFIEFGSFMGTVKEINLFTTVLETPDGIFVSAPNSSIWAGPLKNYTRNGRRRMDLSVGISYSDSVDTAFKVLGQIITDETRFLKDPAPQVMLQSVGDSAVNIMLRAWTPGDAYWDTYWTQTRNIYKRFTEAGLHIPFPQRDIHIIADSIADPHSTNPYSKV
jgi:small conductance mechanosensitive channel